MSYGLFAPLVVYAIVVLLHLVLPGRRLVGYARDASTGEPLEYRLNGLLVLLATLALWWLACAQLGFSDSACSKCRSAAAPSMS